MGSVRIDLRIKKFQQNANLLNAQGACDQINLDFHIVTDEIGNALIPVNAKIFAIECKTRCIARTHFFRHGIILNAYDRKKEAQSPYSPHISLG
jgi:hypothetical protein